MLMNYIKELIFEKKPTENCHASTVLPLGDGTTLSAWFGGDREGTDNVDIWLSIRRDGKWSDPICISADSVLPHWNPVLFKKTDGTVRLFFKVGKKIPFWQTYFSDSSDGGLTWTKPRELVPGDNCGGRGPVKNKAIRLSNGTIAAPASTEQNNDWNAFIDLSFDDGDTWEIGKFIQRDIIDNKFVQIIQPTLWESANGNIHALMRSNSGRAYRSDSSDYGKTWCPAYRTDVLNNNSGIDLVKLDDNRIYLVSNPVEENWGDRAPLTLSLSTDNGKNFTEVLCLESKSDKNDEFSYPAITAIGNKLFITYTSLREHIAYWEIDV